MKANNGGIINMKSMTMKRKIGWIACGMVAALLSISTKAETYYCALTNGQTGYWTNSLMWTNAVGANGVPGINDTVILNQLASGSYDINFTNWSVGTLTINSKVNTRHNLYLEAPKGSDGYVGTLNYSNATPALYNGFYWEGGNMKVTLQQYNIIGPNTPNGRWTGGSGAFLFTNAAQITYHTTNITVLACQADFGGASSVHLVRSTALGTTTMETLGAASANAQPPTYIGRRDNGVQTWTVGAGSHPLLNVPNAYDTLLAKVGTNHVDMSDVDLWCNCTADRAFGISSGGTAAGSGTALYKGEIRANSLTLTRTESATVYTKSFDIVGTLVLDGQGGLQAGGTGNGRAFSVVSNTNGLTLMRFGSHSSAGNAGNAKRGLVSIAPTGGEFYLNGSAPSGSVKLQIYNTPAERTNATLIANTINLASPRVIISDRDPNNDIDDNAGGTIEFRGDFISQSTDTNNFRLDNSTVRAIGGGTNKVQYWECMSKDNGAVSPSTNNFALAKLIVGKTATGSTTNTILSLRDQYDNNTGDSGAAEAVYVTTLEIYAGSQLHLNGLNLYYKNSGSWVKAVESQTPFPYGDGTGYLGAPPPFGTVIMMK